MTVRKNSASVLGNQLVQAGLIRHAHCSMDSPEAPEQTNGSISKLHAVEALSHSVRQSLTRGMVNQRKARHSIQLFRFISRQKNRAGSEAARPSLYHEGLLSAQEAFAVGRGHL